MRLSLVTKLDHDFEGTKIKGRIEWGGSFVGVHLCVRVCVFFCFFFLEGGGIAHVQFQGINDHD